MRAALLCLTESAVFLTPEQRRDIFHHNAAGYLRLGAPGAGR